MVLLRVRAWLRLRLPCAIRVVEELGIIAVVETRLSLQAKAYILSWLLVSILLRRDVAISMLAVLAERHFGRA